MNVTALPKAPTTRTPSRATFRINGCTPLSDSPADLAAINLDRIHALAALLQDAHADAQDLGADSRVSSINGNILARVQETIAHLAAEAAYCLEVADDDEQNVELARRA